MPKPFRELSIEQFAELLDLFPFQRRIDTVHLHHTFRPNHTDFERRAPIESIEGMWRFHTTPEPDGRGWSDIAQHLTIDPRGVLWTGRSWDRAPASATGFNGNEDVGPFMIEMIGNFDRNADPFRDPQRRAAVQAIAAIQRRFGLPPEAIRFHNEMSKKTCPGTQVNKSEFISLLQEEHAALGREVSTNGGVFGPEATLRREAARNLVEALGPSTRTTPSTDHGELPDELLSHGELAFLLGEQEPTRSVSASRGPRQLTPQEKEILRRHVVNLRFGAFSDDGQFETSDADVNHIFDVELPHELERRRALGQKLKLVFFAHGGLVDELSGLLPILSRLDFWRSNGTYPIFFVWETGLRETITDIVRGLFTGRRGVFEDLNDAFIEALAREPGKQVWSQMKRSAEVSVLAGGGALFVIEKLLGFWNANHAEMEVHAVGHSAGSIFHAHFLDTLLRMSQNGQALKVDTLHFLAPAITTQLFHQRLAPHVHDANKIGRLTMYTMNRSLERDDRAGPYRKSLLYLVSRAFEPVSPTPILGLEDSIRADRSLVQLFGLDGGGAKADLLFSTTNGASARNSTTSKSHGDFDNDVATMNSVMRRILGVADATPITNFRNEGESRGFAVEPPQEAAPPMVAIPQPPPQPATIAPAISTTNGRRIALCIGVDEYPPGLELSGCVNDAENWSRTLNRLGFETMTIRNHQATRSGILGRINDLLTSLRAGDTAVIQYAGHGTTVRDIDNDEGDGSDEALCPVDFQDGALIIDDDLRQAFRVLPAGAGLTCFMDCCHSGTITRVVAGLSPENLPQANARSKARFIRPSARIDAAHREFRLSMNGSRAVTPVGPNQMREVLFSACLPTEVAYETEGSGDFTRRATSILGNGVGSLTNEAFQRRVAQAFGNPSRQTPKLDCADRCKQLLLFSV